MFGLIQQVHNQAVYARGKAAVRGRTERERFQNVREPLLLLLLADAEQVEHAGLNVGPMNADAAGTRLLPVADQVVALRPDFAGVGVEVRPDALRRAW